MKPLLLDILACPICKYYPLELDILKWETSDNKFSKILGARQNKDIDYLIKATKIRRGKDNIEDGVVITDNQNVLLKDEMVRKKSNLIEYLSEVEKKLENFTVMEDFSEENFSACLNLIKTDVIKHILDTKTKVNTQKIDDISIDTQKQLVNEILPDIYLLNWFFQFAEIEEGVIFCEKCARWYPIIETIPQMLPDDLREQESEITFLGKWEAKLPKKITKDGKPFNL